MNARLRAIAVTAGLLASLVGANAQASRYDFNLGRYFSGQCEDTCSTDPNAAQCLIDCAQGRFESLMIELGHITAPVFLAPAETLGLNGFAIGFEGTVAPIEGGAAYWTEVTEGKPADVVFIPRVHVRKGLPFSFEIGTQLAYVPESEMFVVGAELKWALNEGFFFVPDIAVRLSINHTIGPKEFELTTGGWDVSISHPFGLGGMVSLTPYAGYNMLFVHSSSHVVLDTHLVVDPATDVPRTYVYNEVSWDDHMFHRFMVGARLTTFIFQFAVEGVFALDPQINIFNFLVGMDF
ncbi:MAG TPA: hypothetical protein PK668_10220 [Myxococcota bacterium]|nr:hypothetical protein [Myxococcota bacterium]HRY93458.1 hypothetical protein [Myxococcota bacterium]HSA20305.1 hypothetical protein [Myxococcota bacterium]